jgi:hypothetical protein
MKTTLFNILWKKEKSHWRMIKEMLKTKFKGASKYTFGIIVALLVTLFHYMFATMHTLYEIVLFIFARNSFKANLQKLALKI